MTHLYIELNTGLTEEVNSSIISKLYELAISGDLDETSDLKGRLHTNVARDIHVSYLTTHYPELYITADVEYFTFEDPNLDSLMAKYIGDGNGVMVTDVRSYTNSTYGFGGSYFNTYSNIPKYLFNNNEERASITTFDEFYNFVNVTSLVVGIFQNCTNLRSITLPALLETISNSAFAGCTHLSSIDLSNVEIIGNYSFELCSSLLSVGTTNSLTQIGLLAFYRASALTAINLTNVAVINNLAFYQCNSLLTIGSILNVTHIYNQAFKDCNNVNEFVTIDLPNLLFLDVGGDGIFYGCTQILHVKNLGTITQFGGIWGGIFCNCTNLKDAVLPETVTYIRYKGFDGCSSLRYVKILSTSVPEYNAVNGFNNQDSYGRAFGEQWKNNDTTNIYEGATYPIYVVDSLLSQYQIADNWKYVGPNRLKPLSQWATDFPDDYAAEQAAQQLSGDS